MHHGHDSDAQRLLGTMHAAGREQPSCQTCPIHSKWRAIVLRSFQGGLLALSPVWFLSQPFIAKDGMLTAVTRPAYGQQELLPWLPWWVVVLGWEIKPTSAFIDQSMSPVCPSPAGFSGVWGAARVWLFLAQRIMGFPGLFSLCIIIFENFLTPSIGE